MRDREPIVRDQTSSRVNYMLIALLGGVVILLAVLWFLSGNRSSDQDKLSNPTIEQTADSDNSKRCSAKATYDLVKRELFRLAAVQRGTDQSTFAQIADSAVLRVENAVLESEDNGALNCSGNFYMDLPPGVATADGRHDLSAGFDYTIAAGGNVLLRNADAMVGPLASLTRVAEPVAPTEGNAAQSEDVANAAAAPSANVPAPARPAPARPSFDCARAGTAGEVAVCSDSGLAGLDVAMAAQYRRALASSSPVQKQLLQTTRDRFLAYRDHCPNRQCMADAYAGRMREIRDIMDGRLIPNR